MNNYSGFTGFNSGKIIDRARNILGLKSDSQLADLLGVHRATVSGWRNRDSLDVKVLLTKLPGINVHWLVTGEGKKDFTEEPDRVSEREVEYGALPDPLKILDKMKRIDPQRLKTILELIDLYSKEE